MHETTKMIPKVVFREEQKHLKPVPELSTAIVPHIQTPIVRKSNVVNYLQNRYAVPYGTYAPGKRVRLEVDEPNNMLKIYDLKTDELIQTHLIATGVVGKCIKNNHIERDRSKYSELKDKVFDKYSDIPNAKEFIEKIMEAKVRYTRDQLSLLKKFQEKYSKEDLEIAVNYCMDRNLFSAVDFGDTLEYFNKKTNQEPTITAIVLPIKYQAVKAKKRDLVAYSSIYEGRCD